MGEQKVQNAQEQDVKQLLKVRRDKLAELQARGEDPFRLTKYDASHHSQEIKDQFEELEGKDVSIAGRMMSKRVMGKASFCNVQDLKGNIQCYVARDAVGEEPYKDFKKYDIGDIIGVRGQVFRTKTGEISIHAAEITLLSKSLQILPEKFHEYRRPLPSALYRPDYERGCKGYLYQAVQNYQQHPPLSGRPGLHGGGDPYAGVECGRSGGASLHDAF